MTDQQPRLGEICEETFLFLTSFSRMAGRTEMNVEDVRLRVQDIFRQQRKRADEDPHLCELYEKAHYLLVVTVDDIVLKSDWSQRSNWPLLEIEEFGTSIGGARFFSMREDPAYRHEELDEVFFICLALGFQGENAGDPGELTEIRKRAYMKLPDTVRRGDERFTPQTTEETDGEEHVKVPEAKVLSFVALMLGIMVGFALLSHYLYSSHVDEIRQIALAIAFQDGQGD